MIMLGAPGSGKGTQAARLSKEFDIAHESSGDAFRKAAAEGTEAGLAAAEFFERGELVPDETVCRVIIEHIVDLTSRGRGILLDGFPRTLGQAVRLEERLGELDQKLDAVVHINIDRAEIKRRLSLRGRSDDSEDVVRHRIAVYDELTRPLVDFYRDRDVVVEIDGNQAVEAVHDEIVDRVRAAVQ
jgi:adenylate kinase